MKMMVIMKIQVTTTYLKVLYHQMVAEKLLIQVPISHIPGHLTTCHLVSVHIEIIYAIFLSELINPGTRNWQYFVLTS
jgi:hypothetical protein